MPRIEFRVDAVPQDGQKNDRTPAPIRDLRPPTAARASRRWRSTDLFGLAHEIEIEHGQAVYRLRLTALGKLILTK